MSMFDSLPGQLGDPEELAVKLGIPVENVAPLMQQIAAEIGSGKPDIAALADTAAQHGVSADALQGLLAQFGGAGGMMGSLSGMLDKDGDGNPLNELRALAKGLFG